MRFIKTFVLHLYVDPAVPERLCGDLTALPEVQPHTFRNQAELIALLLLVDRSQPSSCPAVKKSLSAKDRSGEVIP